jgi:hypothetical protein
MKNYEVTINHDIYHTYIVSAESAEDAEERAMTGEYEYINSIECDSSHIVQCVESVTPASSNIKMTKEQMNEKIRAIIVSHLYNSELDEKSAAEAKFILDNF